MEAALLPWLLETVRCPSSCGRTPTTRVGRGGCGDVETSVSHGSSASLTVGIVFGRMRHPLHPRGTIVARPVPRTHARSAETRTHDATCMGTGQSVSDPPGFDLRVRHRATHRPRGNSKIVHPLSKRGNCTPSTYLIMDDDDG